ncbi:hypothetical protein PBOI14_42310 [Pseudomonas sp. Boi14]|nr:hypothetical protein PBOI14_42310 [Pseudomonas sp. Boi14]
MPPGLRGFRPGRKSAVGAHPGAPACGPGGHGSRGPAIGRCPGHCRPGAQVQLDRQFQVVHAVAVAQQHVQFAQGVAAAADWQVGRQQLDPGGVADGKLPEAFVIQAQAPGRALGQPLAQGAAVQVLAAQPVGQQLRRLDPVAAGEWVALWPGRVAEHRRREDDPGEVADFRLTQLAGKAEQIREQEHLASIDANPGRSR